MAASASSTQAHPTQPNPTGPFPPAPPLLPSSHRFRFPLSPISKSSSLARVCLCGAAQPPSSRHPREKAMELNIVDKYEKLEKVGEGTYGKVYKAQDKATGQLVALKKTRLEMDEEGIPPTALREISLLNLLSHSIYVVRLLAVEQAAKNGKPILYLVFEFLDTDLKKYLDVYRRGPNPRPLPPHQVKVTN